MDVGFNFRSTLGYVTDPANTYAVLGEAYPHTYVGGIVGGWLDAVSVADRSAAIDARLAGINYISGAGTIRFQFDLPATGTYQISLALGDELTGQPDNTVVIKDNAATRLTIGPHNLTADKFYDAADVEYTAANWPGSNSLSAGLTFATTTLICSITSAAGVPVIAHLRIVSSGGVVIANAGRCALLGVGN